MDKHKSFSATLLLVTVSQKLIWNYVLYGDLFSNIVILLLFFITLASYCKPLSIAFLEKIFFSNLVFHLTSRSLLSILKTSPFANPGGKNPQFVCHEFLLYGFPFFFFQSKKKICEIEFTIFDDDAGLHSSSIKVYALLKRRRHIGKSFSLAAGT